VDDESATIRNTLLYLTYNGRDFHCLTSKATMHSIGFWIFGYERPPTTLAFTIDPVELATDAVRFLGAEKQSSPQPTTLPTNQHH
jgi:hypothetical protein